MTKSRPINLSVHRNTVEARRKRTLSRAARRDVEAIIREHDVRAYAFVAIAADGGMIATWDTGSILPGWAFPSTVQEILRRDMAQTDVEETWKPPLPLKG